MLLGLANSICSTQAVGESEPVIMDPADEVLTGWWGPNYAASPWVGRASAGTSGSRQLTSGIAPTTGTAQNGHTPASFVLASSHELNSADFWSTFLAAGGYTAIILC